MVLILTGAVQSGKTRLLAGIIAGFDTGKTGLAGFLSPAVYEGGRLIGYDLAILGREKSEPYIRKLGEPEWERVGPFFFIPEALEHARQTILNSRLRDLLVVDEVGPLELGGGGLWGPLETALARPRGRCLLVVRASCLEALQRKLAGRPFKVFSVEEPATRASLLFEIAPDAPAAGFASRREG